MAGISGLTGNNYFGTSTTGVGTLFSSLKTNKSSSLASVISDYNSIRSGSYYKLMKSYYSNGSSNSDSSDHSISSLASSRVTSNYSMSNELTKVKSAANELSDSANALKKTGSDSVFNTGTQDKIYDAVSSLIKDYNSLIGSASDSSVSSVANAASSLTDYTSSVSSRLKDIGITIDSEDGTLSIDEDTFKNADASTVKELFNGSGSFSASVDLYATSVYNTATVQQSLLSSGLYSSNGTYASTTGSLYDSYF